MNESQEEEIVHVFKAHLGGMYTPEGLLAALGLRLMIPLRTMNDLTNLDPDKKKAAIELIPKLQRPMLGVTDVIRSFS